MSGITLLWIVNKFIVCISSFIINTTVSKGSHQKPVMMMQTADQNSSRSIFYHEKTVVIAQLSNNGSWIASCELLWRGDTELTQFLTRENLTSFHNEEVSLNEMLHIMSICQELPSKMNLSQPSLLERVKSFGLMRSIVRVIAPGTRWCGLGDRALNYYDLGTEVATDQCCRTHDFCPVYLEPGKTLGNITKKINFKTVLLCECDRRFYNCLKAVKSQFADSIGKIYFSDITSDCIQKINGQYELTPLNLTY